MINVEKHQIKFHIETNKPASDQIRKRTKKRNRMNQPQQRRHEEHVNSEKQLFYILLHFMMLML